jgi:hypothetical protein
MGSIIQDHGTQTAPGDEAKSGVIVLKAGTEPTVQVKLFKVLEALRMTPEMPMVI